MPEGLATKSLFLLKNWQSYTEGVITKILKEDNIAHRHLARTLTKNVSLDEFSHKGVLKLADLLVKDQVRPKVQRC